MSGAAECTVAGLGVSRETFEALRTLDGLVRRWNPVINLVSRSTLPNLWDRHIVDSAQLLALCGTAIRRWADLGSGGGFPGLVVAVLARELLPDLHVTLVESDLRKATFLRQAAHALGLQLTVCCDRIEAIPSLQADVLSARALAPLSELLAHVEKHLSADGVALFPKGERHAEEIAEARKRWSFDLAVRPSVADSEAAVLLIRKVRRAE